MNIMKNRKEDVIFVAVLLVLVLVFIVFKVINNKKAKEAAEVIAPEVIAPAVEGQPAKVVIIKKKKPAATIWPELSYSEEFAKYRDGRLVQFNNDCQVFPSSMVIKNGASVMLDNRSKVQQVITLGENKYTLAPYDFEIMTIKAPAIPTTYFVDCNEKQNVTTIIVE